MRIIGILRPVGIIGHNLHNILCRLKRELPMYMAAAKDVSPEVATMLVQLYFQVPLAIGMFRWRIEDLYPPAKES